MLLHFSIMRKLRLLGRLRLMKRESERSLRSKICWIERSSLVALRKFMHTFHDALLFFPLSAERRTNAEGNRETWSWETKGRGEVDAWKAEGRREIPKGTKTCTQAYGKVYAETIYKSKFPSFAAFICNTNCVNCILLSLESWYCLVLNLLYAQAEKLRQKEELRREKEAAKQKAANERATARRIARESMELMEDERLELLELASRSKGLLSMVSLDSDTLQQLDSFRGTPHL
jgi:hypothetical protein